MLGFGGKKNNSLSNTSGSEGVMRDERQTSAIILNAIEDGVMLIDHNGVIQLFNPGAAKITGWPVNEARKLDYRSVIKLTNEKGEAYTREQDPLAMIFSNAKGAIRDNKAFLITRNGKQVPISLSVSPLTDEHLETTGAVAVFRDVTQERLEEKQRSEFISTASHEMRTPVAAIEGYLALALNDRVSTVDERARGYLEKAHESTQHLGKLFQDLLTSAKAEDGRLTSHPVLIELGSYIEQLTNDLRFATDKKGLALEFSVGSADTIDATGGKTLVGQKVIKPLYYVKADPDRMREVITNLFDNAVKYTDQGKITVGLNGDDQVAQIYIHDTGVGIPSEDIPHLFQKFYRVDNSATRTIGGTGLGLYICRKIVELYQGRIWVESAMGKGSTFFINLPRLNNEQAENERRRETTENALNPITNLANPVIQ
ncbi:ATP-binding protein [Patescibacteria group bacterium]|nr:ATP-binding protein [Patescibacteria group bacterium]